MMNIKSKKSKTMTQKSISILLSEKSIQKKKIYRS